MKQIPAPLLSAVLAYWIKLTGIITSPASAQTLYNQGQIISIGSGVVVTVQGGLSNEGKLTNEGSVSVSGDWINTGSYHTTIGEVIFNGNSPQSIIHRGQYFNSLTIDGTGEKILHDSLRISSRLVLHKGIVTPVEGSMLLMSDKTTLLGGSAVSHINGKLYHEGNGHKFFPIGKNGHYVPASLENVKGIQPVIGLEVFEPNPNLNAKSNLSYVLPDRYWQKTILSGSLIDTRISLSLNAISELPTNELLVVVESESLTSPFQSLGKEPASQANEMLLSKQPITGNYFTIGISATALAGEALYIPNAFAPASVQPEERVIKIYGNQLTPDGFAFRIYNRWGNLVYETYSLDNMSRDGWNGINSFTRQQESPGVYTYTLKGQYKNGGTIQRTGTVTFVR